MPFTALERMSYEPSEMTVPSNSALLTDTSSLLRRAYGAAKRER